jgi:hypothetical protein
MKQTFLILFLFYLTSFSNANAQACIPNNDTIAGIEPDTLAVTYVNVPYEEVIYFHLPGDTNVNFVVNGDTIPVHLCIDSLTIDSVHGLPDGFSFGCSVPWCSVLGNGNGCAAISGTANESQVGIHPLDVFVTIYTNDCYGFELPPQNDTVSFYYLDVQFATGMESIHPSVPFTIGDCFPNPASSQVSIPYYLERSGEVHISVMDLQGKIIDEKNLHSKAGYNVEQIDVTSLPEASYLVRLTFEGTDLFTRLQVTK